MSALATLGVVGVSLAALGYLTATDPKRRRVFRLKPARRRHGRLGWAVVLLPGLLLPAVAGAGGFFVWLGATSVVGWGLAAISPTRAAATAARLREAAGALGRSVAPLADGAVARAQSAMAALRAAPRPSALQDLERRVAELEAEIALLRRGEPAERPDDDHVVVDLARRR